MVEVRVSLDEDDPVGGRQLLCEDGSSVYTTIRAAEDDDVLSVSLGGIGRDRR